MGEGKRRSYSDAESRVLLDRCWQADVGWIVLIKEIRSRYGLSLSEAQELALSHEAWRRWVAKRLNVDPRCKKQASRHIRDHGSASFFVQRGDRIEFR